MKNLRITFSPAGWQELKDLSRELQIPETEVLRKGLQLMKLHCQLKQGGGCIMVRDQEGTKELIIS